MHLLIPVAQASFLKFLRNQELSTKSELARQSKRTYDSVRCILANLKNSGLVIEYLSENERSLHTYGLCGQLSEMSDEDFNALIENTISAKGMPVKKPKPVSENSHVKEILKDSDAISFIKLNRSYMKSSAMAKNLGVSAKIIKRVEDKLGLNPISDDELDPQAHQIISDLGFIPAGSEIQDSKIGGTTIHMPGNQPGITRITRYYGC